MNDRAAGYKSIGELREEERNSQQFRILFPGIRATQGAAEIYLLIRFEALTIKEIQDSLGISTNSIFKSFYRFDDYLPRHGLKLIAYGPHPFRYKIVEQEIKSDENELHELIMTRHDMLFPSHEGGPTEVIFCELARNDQRSADLSVAVELDINEVTTLISQLRERLLQVNLKIIEQGQRPYLYGIREAQDYEALELEEDDHALLSKLFLALFPTVRAKSSTAARIFLALLKGEKNIYMIQINANIEKIRTAYSALKRLKQTLASCGVEIRERKRFSRKVFHLKVSNYSVLKDSLPLPSQSYVYLGGHSRIQRSNPVSVDPEDPRIADVEIGDGQVFVETDQQEIFIVDENLLRPINPPSLLAPQTPSQLLQTY